MDSRTKVFRAHRALAWFYAFLGAGISAAVILGSRGNTGIGVLLVPLIFACVFSVHYFTARACREGKSGGRVASIVIACLMLLGFPIGTLIGIYLLANTWRPWPAAPNAT
jgi:hypothetical protein